MREDVARMWIADMREGEYTKGKGYMRRRIGTDLCLCPLGILSELAIREGVVVDVQLVDGQYSGDTYWTYDGTYGAPPHSVADWAGQADGFLLGGWRLVVPDAVVSEINGARPKDTPYYRHGDLIPLSTVNDYTDCSLQQIADYMELHYLA